MRIFCENIYNCSLFNKEDMRSLKVHSSDHATVLIDDIKSVQLLYIESD